MTHTPPTVGAEGWGPVLNTALADIDATAEGAQTTADGKADATAHAALVGVVGDVQGAVSDLEADLATKADAAAVTSALAGKADSTHAHAQSDITGLSTALSGKAATSHTHAEGDVTGLTAALAGKAASTHSHAQSDITGLSTALSGKSDTGHVHAGADITSGTVAFARLPTGTSSSQVAVGDHAHGSLYYTETEVDALLDGALTPSGITLAGGDDLAVGGMLTYTPVITNIGSGTYTPRGRYMYLNDHLVYVQGDITMTAAGTGTGFPTISLPVTPDRTVPVVFGLFLGDSGDGAKLIQGSTQTGASGAQIDKMVILRTPSGSFPGAASNWSSKGFQGADLLNGAVLRFSGLYFV